METITILVIEDNPGDARLIKEYLKTDTSANYSISITTTLAESLKTLSNKKFDVVLVDLGLPDSQGVYTFHEIINASPGSPVVIITGTDNENIGIEVIQGGAQNYLVKNQINPTLLVRTIKYAIEIKRKNTELKESWQKYRSIFEGAASLILSVNPAGNIMDCNNRIQQLLGYCKDEVIGKPIKKIIHPDSYEKAKKSLEEVFKKGILCAGEYKMTRKDGETVFVNIHSSALKDEDNKNMLASCIIDDITQRILEEKKQLLTTKILAILNRSNEWHNLIYDILFEIRKYSGIQAIGIRYKEGEDYPYFDAIGFPDSFIKKENFLCARNKKGELVYDADGMPFLECMCGNIISKRTDLFLSYFTEAGSFWTNSTTNLLTTTTKKDRQTDTRNYCNSAGYESVALIPLISENETMGLLQLNDKRKNMFTEEMIHLFENIGLTLGIAFKRIKTEKLIIDSEEKYRELFESARDGILILDADTGQVLDANPYISEKTGYSHAELTAKKIWEIGFFKNIVANQDKFLELQQNEYVHYEDLPVEMADGQLINIEFVSNLYLVDNVKVIQCNIRDISARKCTERTLQALSLRQKAILLAVPDIIMEVDSNKVYTWANKSGLEFFGEDVIGKEAQYYFEGEQNTYDKVHPIFAGDENIIYIESWQRRKDGQKRLLAWWCRVLKDEKGKVVTGALSTARDITERKQMEENLEATKNHLDSLVKASPTVIYTCEVSGAYAANFVSENVLSVFGHTPQEFLSYPGFWAEHIHPEDKERVFSGLVDILDKGSHMHEYRFRIKNDSYHWVHDELTVAYDNNMDPTELCGYMTDINKRKMAEESLEREQYLMHTLMNNVPDNIYFKDLASRFIRISKAQAQMFGLNDPSEAEGKTDFDFFTEEHAHQAYKDELEIIRTRKPISKEEKETWADRPDTWVLTTKLPLYNKEEKIVGTFGISLDITERKQAEILLREKNLEIEAQNKEYQQLNEELLQTNEELQQAKEKAEESDRLKTSFLHNISHEIRTPLNGIIGFTDIITNPDLSHEKKEQFSRIIRDSSYQLLSIVDDIISIAAIEAGHEKPCPRESDINRLLELIKNQNYLSAETKNLSFTVSSDLSDDKAIVMVDETKLLQILTNLVNNAIKFTLKGHIEVKCRLDGNFMKFTVKDTGIGIPHEMHDKIFDRFFQIDHNDTRLYGGTGLGLSIVKSYVHFLNGEIRMDSKPEKGTVFIISIPYKPVKQTERVNIPVHDDVKQIGPATILIAEDETSNYELLSAYLSDFDLTIIHAANGLQAVKACKDNPSISLVLMDVKMPRMDGYEAARQIKKFRPQLPVIIQSAYIFQDKREKSISTYIDGFIEKPINRDVLMENLYKHLQTPTTKF